MIVLVPTGSLSLVTHAPCIGDEVVVLPDIDQIVFEYYAEESGELARGPPVTT